MTYRDDDPSPAPGAPHAMVGGPYSSSSALVAQAPPAPMQMVVAPPIGFASQDVLRGAMDANTFMHALRRRWLLALCMGLVTAGITAVVLWILFPESSSATALFQVYSEPNSLVSETYHSPQSFEIMCKTQLALLKSYFVLQAAVRDPSIASLSMFAGEEPVQWLQDNLRVDFPQQSEILSISLSGDDFSEEQRLVVDAVAKAYKSEVIYSERQKRLVTRDALARSLANLTGELNNEMHDYYDIARELNVTQASGRDPQLDLLLSDVAVAQKKKTELESAIIQMRTEFAVMKQQLEDPSMIEAQVDEYLASDPQMEMLKQNLMYQRMRLTQINQQMKRPNNRNSAGLEKQIAQLQNEIAQYREEITQQIKGQYANAPNSQLQSLTKEFQVRYGAMQQQWTSTEELIKKKMEELNGKMEQSVELQTREAKLDQLQEIAKDMSIKLETLDVEAEAPEQTEQIQQIQPAVITLGINTVQHYSIATMGGIGAFALTAFGIAFMEFSKRRLNEPNQLDEGLGIRVVGTLPSVSGRSGDPNSLVAQVTASVDSVRTILMHDSTSKRRQMVLVTSADAAEGRTTVASQLAASLARAGRRTLLIDGDLRRPKLHELFDVTLEDGLCEVLRAEVDVADVIRPTHSEGLWLLTAGYCDRDAIQALATEQMQPIFDKLRSEYDFIIIDGAPLLGISDALIFGQYSDGAILSVRRDHSQMPKIYQASELLRGVGIRIIGSVVNGVPSKADDRITQLQLITSKSDQLNQES